MDLKENALTYPRLFKNILAHFMTNHESLKLGKWVPVADLNVLRKVPVPDLLRCYTDLPMHSGKFEIVEFQVGLYSAAIAISIQSGYLSGGGCTLIYKRMAEDSVEYVKTVDVWIS